MTAKQPKPRKRPTWQACPECKERRVSRTEKRDWGSGHQPFMHCTSCGIDYVPERAAKGRP